MRILPLERYEDVTDSLAIKGASGASVYVSSDSGYNYSFTDSYASAYGRSSNATAGTVSIVHDSKYYSISYGLSYGTAYGTSSYGSSTAHNVSYSAGIY